jgi:GT2 family glycosyltransferase
MFGVVVNYFAKPDHPTSVKESAKFAVSLLKNCPEVNSVILVDGSSEVDTEFQNYCESIGVNYQHAGKQMSFAEAYNYGVNLLSEEWIVTMASDIYVFPETFTNFKNFIEKNQDLQIGCLIPYLSRCDLPIQRTAHNFQKFSCYAPIMSYNLNVFPKAVFQKIGGLSTKYSGNFNDIDTSIKLKEMGLNIFMLNSYVHHYGRLTLRHGSNVDARGDWQQFYTDYPELKCNSDLWNIRLDKFLRHPLLKIVFLMNLKVKNKDLRTKINTWIYDNISNYQRVKS